MIFLSTVCDHMKKQIISLLGVLIFLGMNQPVRAADDEILDLRPEEGVTVRVIEMSQHPIYGAIPAQIEIEDRVTHEKQILELDVRDLGASSSADAPTHGSTTSGDERDGVHVVVGFRAKIPELIGVRIGVRINDRIEAGIDMGSYAIVNGIGGYLNYHPFDGARGLYIGGKVYRELLVFIGVGTATSYEGVLGVRFGPKGSGIYGFAEAGAAVFVNDTQDRVAIVLPSVALGVGYSF